jgi:ribonuclease T2
MRGSAEGRRLFKFNDASHQNSMTQATKTIVSLTTLALLMISGCGDSNAPASNAPTPIANAAPKSAEQTQAGPQAAEPASAAPKAVPQGAGFDFYVLALSWSPAYCQLKGASADPAQCAASKPYRFIVHGLWPQNEHGYPGSCATGGYPSREQVRLISDLTPSPGLVRHEWEKHGTCSGLSPSDYFAVLRAASDSVAIPAQFSGSSSFSLSPQSVETAFVRSNPGLSAGGIATSCDSGLLTEVRVCLTKLLGFRSCPEVDRSGCRAKSVTIEPAQ